MRCFAKPSMSEASSCSCWGAILLLLLLLLTVYRCDLPAPCVENGVESVKARDLVENCCSGGWPPRRDTPAAAEKRKNRKNMEWCQYRSRLNSSHIAPSHRVRSKIDGMDQRWRFVHSARQSWFTDVESTHHARVCTHHCMPPSMPYAPHTSSLSTHRQTKHPGARLLLPDQLTPAQQPPIVCLSIYCWSLCCLRFFCFCRLAAFFS